MRLVVLDPVYLNQGHIGRLKRIALVKNYETLPRGKDEIVQRIKGADIVITSSIDINGEIIQQCESLKMISLACSGFNRIDLESCNRLGIAVTNAPDYATEAVAEHTFALLFAVMKKIREGDERVRKGKFNNKDFFIMQLKNKIFGVVGTGRIGSRVAKIANCFGCKVIATTLHPSIERAERLCVHYVALPSLLKVSDIISLHVPLNTSTVDMINHEEFCLMQKKPILINTSRGKIINHKALVWALSKGIISMAALDVLPQEPPKKGDGLLKFSNVVFSPHSAFRTREALESCADTAVSNIEYFIAGYPKNIINFPDNYAFSHDALSI